jgi:hypothetical protein
MRGRAQLAMDAAPAAVQSDGSDGRGEGIEDAPSSAEGIEAEQGVIVERGTPVAEQAAGSDASAHAPNSAAGVGGEQAAGGAATGPKEVGASEHFQEGSQHDVAGDRPGAPAPGTGSALERNEPPAKDQHAPVNDEQVRATVEPPTHQILKSTRSSRVLVRTICMEVALNSYITSIKFSKARCILTFT